MTTATKLIIGFLILIGTLVGSTLIILLRVRSIEGKLEELARARDLTTLTRQIELNLVTHALNARNFEQNRNPDSRRQALADLARVDQLSADYSEWRNTARRRQLAEEFDLKWTELKAMGGPLLDDATIPTPTQSQQFYVYRLGLERMVEDQMQVDADAEFAAREKEARKDVGTIVGFALLILIGGVAVALATSLIVVGNVVSTEKALAATRERSRVTLASIGDAVITTDHKGRVDYLNAVAEELTGWTGAEASGRDVEEIFRIISEDTRETVEGPAAKALKEGTIVGLANHTILISKSGVERYIDDSAAPIRNDSGAIAGCVLIFRDVTEKRRVTQIIQESEARSRAILETAIDCIVTIDHEGKVLEFNPAAEATFGYSRKDAIGKEVAELIIPPIFRERHFKGLAKYLATGEGPVLGSRLELPAMRADGSEIPVELTITAVPQDGPPIFTAYIRDLSSVKEAERHRAARIAVTQVLAESSSFEVAAPRLLSTIGEHLGWKAGAIWLPNGEETAVECVEYWRALSLVAPDFETITRSSRFPKGQGLPGRVWASGELAWIPDVVQDDSFPRAPIASKAGLHAAIGIPFKSQSEIIGVIEYFSDEIREPDADLIETMATIVAQISSFIIRLSASEANRETSERLQSLLSSIHDRFLTVDSDWRHTYFNEAARLALEAQGVDADNLIGTRLFEGFPALAESECGRELKRAMKDRVHVECEYYFEAWNRWFEVRATPTSDGGLAILSQDITDRKRSEEALRENEQRLRLALDAGKMGDWEWTIATNTVEWSASLEAIHGLEAGTFPGTFEAYQLDIHPDDRELVSSAITRSLTEAEEHHVEYRIITPDNQVRWVEGRGKVVRNESGEPIRVIGVCTDITDRKSGEVALRQSEEALKHASVRKDEFLATLAHELRNPLAPILNALEVIKSADGNIETIQKARETSERQLNHLTRLIEDLLDMSRITQDKLELRRSTVDLAAIVNHAMETAQPLADSMNHVIKVELPEKPIYLDADAVRLAQIFSNLLSNGCKYTEPGGVIRLSARQEGTFVSVSVSDSGVGIPAEKLPHIFEMFTQVDHSLERTQSGLGIGLTLVKRLVEMHDGEVIARSDGLGKGSEFVVRLPIVKEFSEDRPEQAPALENGRFRTHRILVIDDNVDNAITLAALLEIAGHETKAAHDGESGIALAEAFRPDVVLMDIGMPIMNGYEAARAIREKPWGKEMAIVALTGWGQDADRQRSIDAGFDAHLVKPVGYETLKQMLEQIIKA